MYKGKLYEKTDLGTLLDNIPEDIDAYYVLWTSDFIHDHNVEGMDPEKPLWGFNSEIVRINHTGIVGKVPDWIENTNEKSIEAMMFQIIPNLEDF